MDVRDLAKILLPQGIKSLIRASRRRRLCNENVIAKQKALILADNSIDAAVRSRLAAISLKVNLSDGMYNGDLRHYLLNGSSAIDCILASMSAAEINRDKAKSILDMPCGHGRVTRFLVNTYPSARIVACDIQAEAVDFCVEWFGTEGLYSVPTLDALEFGRKFDLIWCGSLFTHFSSYNIRKTLALFARSLSENGLAVFTTHGDYVANRPTDEYAGYGMDAEAAEQIKRDYQDNGFGFQPYPQRIENSETKLMEMDYGISLTSPKWIRRMAAEADGLTEVLFLPRGWDDHQDVFAFRNDGRR